MTGILHNDHRDNTKTGEFELNATEVREKLPEQADTVAAATRINRAFSGENRTLIGTKLRGRFVIEEEIGRGGMGTVYLAQDVRKSEALDKDTKIAIKILSEEITKAIPNSFIMLQREAKKAQQLSHPNIVNVYDFDRDGEVFFLTMELLEGRSLDKIIAEMKGGMPVQEVIGIVGELCAGLSYAHRKGLVHSDIKPSNIFLTSDGEVKILDFGVAATFNANTGMADKMAIDKTAFDPRALGMLSKPYASLEMFNQLPADPSDDVYAVACVTYELLSRHHPYNRIPAMEAAVKKLLPNRIETLNRNQWFGLKKALAFDREHRYLSVDDFFDAFSRRKPGVDGRRRFTGLVLVLLILGISGYFFVGNKDKVKAAWNAAQHSVTGAWQRLASKPNDNLPVSEVRKEVGLELIPVNRKFSVGEKIWFGLEVTNDAYVHCYYQSGNNISRIFPNRFRESALVKARQRLEIPDMQSPEGLGFSIVIENPSDAISCVATLTDIYRQLPSKYQMQDLESLDTDSMTTIVTAFQKIDQMAEVQELRINIR